MTRTTMWVGHLGAGCILASALTIASSAQAQAPAHTYDIPAQTLGSALSSVARRSGVAVIAPSGLIRGLRSPALRGEFPPDVALRLLLEGSGLVAEPVGGAYVVKRPARSQASDGGSDSDIVVTGSRIRGAPVASTMIRIDAEAARSAGQATITDVIRSIPQNFGGGQNPGIGLNVPEANGTDIGGGSSLNLRGLGSDATLTLLNGHRLPYSSAVQSVDVSAIPLDAVDRIEIVADGASAIYGSDAVAGVANIILKQDYDGLRTSTRIGASTEGGNRVQQYAAVAGKTWTSGGLLVAYQFDRSTRIRSSQRNFAATLSPGVTLFPFIKRHSVVVSGHQDLLPGVTFSMDGLYGRRWKAIEYPLNPVGDLSVSRIENNTRSRNFVISPSLKGDLGGGWRAELTGVYGKDKVIFGADQFFGAAVIDGGDNCYCNEGRAVELGADGPLFELPGGNAQLAVGLGWRDNKLVRSAPLNPASNLSASQDSRFAYGEVNLPFVSRGQGIKGVHHLSLSAAMRYERYPGIGSVATPKVGLIYAPVEGFTLKSSWGKSFRAPTLIQLHFLSQAIVAAPGVFGGTGFPPGSTVVYLVGGNKDLKPERATTWSATALIEPVPLPGLRLEISVFHTRYTDRIVTPIVALGTSLSNSAFADLVQRGPSAAEASAALNSVKAVTNISGAPFDPARVVALINNYYANASRQTVKGVDMLANYRWQLGDGVLDFAANASLLDSSQVRGTGQSSTKLAGIIFNPPHFRARGSVNWSRGPLNLSLAVNRIGGLSDTRSSPVREVGGMTTFDAALRFRPVSGFAEGFDVIVSAENLFDKSPAVIRKSIYYDTPYDSTNYSPIGRFVSVTLAKSW